MTYSDIGLRRNPFAVSLDVDEEAERFLPHREIRPPGLADAFVQLIGRRGAGKTTLIQHWRRLRPGPYRHVQPDRTRWQSPPVAPIVYWDEADRIPVGVLIAALARARRHGAVVIAGTHRDLSRPAGVAGMAVRTVIMPQPTPERVVTWAKHHIQRVAIRPVTLEVSLELAEAVVADCGGSWRVIGDRLHSWAARAARAAGDQPMIEAISDASASERPRHSRR
jgi:energy-coupling factor transporter ATP-binding protein EcfA2